MSETLRTLTDDELAGRYAAAQDDDEVLAVLAEIERREAKARRTEIDKARWAAVYEEWHLFAHAQYLAADEACRGNLIRREYAGEVETDWDLWSSSHRWARERATDELREFWDANPRLTVTEFREHQRAARRDAKAARAAATGQHDN